MIRLTKASVTIILTVGTHADRVARTLLYAKTGFNRGSGIAMLVSLLSNNSAVRAPTHSVTQGTL